MFALGQVISEWIKFILSLGLIGLIIWRCGGVSFLFRVILRTAGLNFKKGILGKADDEIFYTQKFALLNGVKVANTQDANILSKGVMSGEISRGQFFFTTFFGTIGQRKKSHLDNWFLFMVGIILIIVIILMINGLPKKGYANYTYDETRLQISKVDILTPKKFLRRDESIDKNECIRIIKSHPHDMLRSACEYIVLNDKDKKEELTNAINSWEEPRKVLFISLSLFFCLFICCIAGAINHEKLNRYLLERKQ